MKLEEQILQYIQLNQHTLNRVEQTLSALTQPQPDRLLFSTIVQLDTTKTSGLKQLDLPFPARYVAIVNQTASNVFLADGRQAIQPLVAFPVAPNGSQNYALTDTKAVTLFWSGQPIAGANTVVLQFSDQPIQLSTSGSVSVNNTSANPVLTSLTGSNNTVQPQVLSNGSYYTFTAPNWAGDGNTSLGLISAGGFIFNGSTWDRLRSVPGATGVQSTPYSGTQSAAITTATATAVKVSKGVVGTITNAGAATSGTITIYDNTSATGKQIWSGTLTAGQVLPLGIPCGTGITIVTAAANTLAVSYA